VRLSLREIEAGALLADWHLQEATPAQLAYGLKAKLGYLVDIR
jgi:hypothetical protein